jgi:perosamine synthetase
MNDLGKMAPPRASDAPLAIHGGAKSRQAPMPTRFAMGPDERRMLELALDYYAERNLDPGYEGHFEKHYTALFAEMMGGGYADAVASGTAALFVAIAALELPKGSEVIVSPITDPGTLSAIVLNGLRPRLVDTAPDSFNVGLEQLEARITPNVSAAVIVHALGFAADIDLMVEAAHAKGIKVVEDCSQSHFAKRCARPVGTFGDISAFSTMYRKAHMAGASGGMVYSGDRGLFEKALVYADRGKPRYRDEFDDRDPSTYLAPALNFNTDELSCAIGIASLQRLPETMIKRLSFASDFVSRLRDASSVCEAHRFMPAASPFVYPVFVNGEAISCSPIEFAEAVRAEGIGLNSHYKYLVYDWNYIRRHLADDFDPPNARKIRDRSFMLYLNEKYGEQESRDAVKAIVKVERYFGRKDQ